VSPLTSHQPITSHQPSVYAHQVWASARTPVGLYAVYRILVNSRFLQRPQKQSRGNQLIHRRFSKAKSIGSGSDSESQAGINQTAMVDGDCS